MNALKRIAEYLLGTKDQEVEIETLSETLAHIDDFIEDSNLSYLEQYLIADRMEKIGKEIRTNVRDNASSEFELFFDESTDNYLSNKVTVSTIPQYDYPENDSLKKYEEKIEENKSVMKPCEDEIKQYKDGIKAVKEQMVVNGEAIKTGTTNRISISKK